MGNHKSHDLNRRQFIQQTAFIVPALAALPAGLLALSGCGAGNRFSSSAASSSSEGPAAPSWQIKMAPETEPGTPLIVSGTIFEPDGVKPAEGITLYVYHTDARGYYSEQDGNGQRPQPRLKGWMKTRSDGRYEFRTIRPASYPGSRNPAHIHASISGPGYPEYWIEEFWFEGDPFVTIDMRSRVRGEGRFSPIVALRDERGVLLGTRDIKLERG